LKDPKVGWKKKEGADPGMCLGGGTFRKENNRKRMGERPLAKVVSQGTWREEMGGKGTKRGEERPSGVG